MSGARVPGDILIHHSLFDRMRAKAVGLGAVGLYVLICQDAAAVGVNGTVARPNWLRPSMDDDLQTLKEAGFIRQSPDGTLTIQDWGEWVVAQGEAGAGAE